MNIMNKNIVIFTGQTASGKTGLAIEYALKNNGDIICMDSMQIYKYMPMLSACPTDEEKSQVPHHLFEFVEPTENFSVSLYSKLAREKIEEVLAKGKLPILVGGTGLYMNAILYMNLEEVPHDKHIREELEKEETKELYDFLISVDSKTNIHANDRKRIIRALEIYKITGKTKTELDKANKKKSEYSATIYAKKFEREELYKRINVRTKEILDNGAIDEVKRLISVGVNKTNTAGNAIGFSEIKEYIEGRLSYGECLEKFRQVTRNYAKRQETWFKANKEIIWV